MAKKQLREWKPEDGAFLVEALYGDSYKCTGLRFEDGALCLEVESRDHSGECPHCGAESAKMHAVYYRTFEDLPLGGIRVMTRFKVRTYNCVNEDCGVASFAEYLPFVGRNQKRSTALDNAILAAASMTAHETASKQLKEAGINVSPAAIDRLCRKMQIEDDTDVRIVGIDDIATKKGRKYATVIYNGETGALLCLLKGRDVQAVDGWLQKHPNIQIVARDRASAYAAAVSKNLPNAEQVADRFHLMQNLVGYLSRYLRDNLPKEIWVDNDRMCDADDRKSDSDDGEEASGDPDHEWIRATDRIADEHRELAYDNSPPADAAGTPIPVDSQLHTDRQKSSQKRVQKQRLIRDIQSEQLHNPQSVAAVAKKWNVSQGTAKKYLEMPEDEIEKLGKPAVRKAWGHGLRIANVVYKMMEDGHSDRVSFSWIRAHYSDVPDSAIIHTMQAVQANHFPMRGKVDAEALRSLASEKKPSLTAERVTRGQLSRSILTLDPEKAKEDPVTPALPSVLEKIPEAAFAREALERLHALLTGHHPEDLHSFIDDYGEGVLESFCNGLKQDFHAVQNAAVYSINSGFVEGSNNKVKLIKRLAYGRADIPALQSRIWIEFQISKMHRHAIDFVHYPKRVVS